MQTYLYQVNPWWQKKKSSIGLKRPHYLRPLMHEYSQNLIQIITGLRRVGKSTLMLQLIKKLIKKNGINPKHILFFSVEEPSLMHLPIAEIISEFRALWDISLEEKIHVFIDEIQFREEWEREIKSLYDSQNIKFVLSGSSAMLLSEKIPYLTGRYLKTQVNPLTFSEYLFFKKKTIDLKDQHLLVKASEDYLKTGGMPEFVLHHPDKYLETTVESILFKDIVSKFKLRNPKMLLDMMYLLSDRVGSNTSFLRLSKVLQINKDTVAQYIDYLQKVFLISGMQNYSESRNKQIYNPEKMYFTDLGIASAYASKVNLGALAENAVYSHLFQESNDIKRVQLGYWYEDGSEIDFILRTKNTIRVFESKWVDSLEEINFKPLEKMTKHIKSKGITYVTRSLRSRKEIHGIKVQFIPLHEFLQKKLSKDFSQS